MTSLDSEITCQVICEAGALFASNQSEFTTGCGPSTGFSWTHEATSHLPPSCSGTAAGSHDNTNANFEAIY